jgi:hypothetical protein
MSNCNEPEITDKQHEIFTGLMMGDGSTSSSDDRKPYIQVTMKNKEFLNWLDSELGILSTGVREVEGTGFAEGSIYYKLITRRLNSLKIYDDWYGENGKVFPNDITLSPLTLKIWYCCDGDKSVDNRWSVKEYARISSHNEVQNKSKINKYFDELNFSPNWNDGGRFTFGRYGSYEFWNYIGEPLPGFEYKWPNIDYENIK